MDTGVAKQTSERQVRSRSVAVGANPERTTTGQDLVSKGVASGRGVGGDVVASCCRREGEGEEGGLKKRKTRIEKGEAKQEAAMMR